MSVYILLKITKPKTYLVRLKQYIAFFTQRPEFILQAIYNFLRKFVSLHYKHTTKLTAIRKVDEVAQYCFYFLV